MGVNRRRQRALLPDAPLIRVAGRMLRAEVESHRNPLDVDHVWIWIDVGGEVMVSVNTRSKRNQIAGFDSRIRVGIVRETWDVLPAVGAEIWDGMDYAQIEAGSNVFFEHYEREGLEKLLLASAAKAALLEAWGAPYRHRLEGIHQIHSRRASCAVPEDIVGRDGALKFYFEPDRTSLLLLFKFCGQP